MWRFGLQTLPAYLLVIGLFTLLMAVVLWQRQRTGKTIVVWLSAGILGILLGSVGSYALVYLTGYHIVEAPRPLQVPASEFVAASAGSGGQDGEAGPGGGRGMGDEMGMGGGMGMGRGMGGGMFGGPRPKRDLTTLVRKIDLLTGDVAITLAAEQSASLLKALDEAENTETMSDDEAQAKHDAILSLFTDDQKRRLEAVGLPRGPRGPRGGGSGGGPPAADANPFQEETNSQALVSLRQKFQPDAK